MKFKRVMKNNAYNVVMDSGHLPNPENHVWKTHYDSIKELNELKQFQNTVNKEEKVRQ